MKKNALFILYTMCVLAANAQRVHIDKESLYKLESAAMAISTLYVDSVDDNKLVEDAIRGMLKELDPHSSYSTAKETKSMNEPLQGQFEGVGIQFNISQDTLIVIQTVANGPSEKVGILAGDRLTSVDDTIIAGVKMSRTEIMKRLRGPKGTKVRLKVVRRGIQDTLAFVVTRDKIPVKTINAAFMMKPTIGYIKIESFGIKTHDEFMDAVDSLKRKGMRDLIVDLCDNGGGYLQSAVKIANEFLHKDDLIVYTEGRAAERQDFRADGRGRLTDGKVVVLVNEYSASAAEILSGAIQDQDRGEIVGRRSFGKGLVQRPIDFSDGSMIRLTTSHYYTPSGRCIQKPYEKGDKADYDQDIEKRFRHGELYSRDSIRFDDAQKFETLRQHRTVYGGGGIMPDHFVPLDTTQYTFYHRQLAAKGVIIGETLKYVDRNRKDLRREYPNFDDFEALFEPSDEMLQAVYDEGENANVKLKDEDERLKTAPLLKRQIKALIARDLWDMSEYYKIMNLQNHIVMKGLEVLTSPSATEKPDDGQ